MLLVATAGCSAIVWATRLNVVDPISFLLVIGNILVLGSLVSWRFEGVVRGAFLICFAIAIAFITNESNDSNRWWSPLPFFSPASLLACLMVLIIRDALMAVPGILQRASIRIVLVSSLFLALLVYLVAIPSVAVLIEQFREKALTYTLEEQSLFEQFRVFSSKVIIFAVFTYAGACIASFINVVASSAPRGESIALRTSACPRCGVPIRRLDNLPIFSYLNLAGRCRRCAARIPVRYLIVEIVGAVIFGSLFLFELVTGGANIPGFQHYHYTGIVWIILYTKWPVVGIYFYHVALFSCLMMLALMDLDRLRCPRWLMGLLIVLFAALPIVFPTLQPVPFFAQLGIDLRSSLPPWATCLVTSVFGGTAGWLMAKLLMVSISRRKVGSRWLRRFAGHQFPLSGALIGIVLGWQATLTIVFFALIATLLLMAVLPRRNALWRYSATAILSAVAFLHQPAWKWLAGLW